jgi:NitT/TauT family transport system permease protein
MSGRTWFQRLGPVIALVGSFLIWEGVVEVFHTKPFILPGPITVVTNTWDVRSELLHQAVPTLEEIWLGFAIAVAGGLLIAIPIAFSPLVEAAVLPILVAIQVTPTVCLAPLFLIWLGFGMTPKIAVAALVAFFPVVVNTTRGLRAGEPEMVQWMRSLGARPWEIFFKLKIRWAMPYIMTALKVAITLAAVGALIGEFIGTDRGLGYVILRSTTNLDTPVLYGTLLFICFLGILAYGLIALLERVALSWQRAAEAAPRT